MVVYIYHLSICIYYLLSLSLFLHSSFTHSLSFSIPLLRIRFDGKVPSNYEDLESLPGVGHKTASVLMSQSFGEPAIAVDTHVHRLALRWKLTKDEKSPDNVQRDLCKIFPKDRWNKLHLQMIYFGREYCPAKGHEPRNCPVCSWINRPPTPAAGEGTGKGEYITDAEIDSFRRNHTFTKAKGIVYYSDRTQELLLSPQLTNPVSPMLSTAKGSKSNIEMKSESLLSEFDEDQSTTNNKSNSKCGNKTKSNNSNSSSNSSTHSNSSNNSSGVDKTISTGVEPKKRKAAVNVQNEVKSVDTKTIAQQPPIKKSRK